MALSVLHLRQPKPSRIINNAGVTGVSFCVLCANLLLDYILGRRGDFSIFWAVMHYNNIVM